MPIIDVSHTKAPAMRLETLRVQNFRALREVDITFPDGLMGIMGHNGSGKTTLLRSMTYSLYGMDGVRWRKERLLGPNGPNAEVVFGFSLAEQHYLVTRSLRGKDLHIGASLTCDGELRAEGNEAVTKEVVRLLGSASDLGISRFVAQKEVNALSGLDPAPRKRQILSLVGIEGVEEAAKGLRQQVTDFDRTIKARRAILPNVTDIEAQVAAARRRQEALALEQGVLEVSCTRTRAAAETAEDELRQREADAGTVATHIASLEIIGSQLADLDAEEERLAARESALTTTAEQLSSVEAQLAEIETHRTEYAALEQASGLRRLIPDLEAQRSALQAVTGTIQSELVTEQGLASTEAPLARGETGLVSRLEKAGTSRALAEAEREELRLTLARGREEQTKITRRLESLSDNQTETGNCPTCGQPLADPAGFRQHLEETLNELRSAERETIHNGKAAKTRSEAALTERATLEQQLAELRRQLTVAREAAGSVRLAQATLQERREQLSQVSAQLEEAGDIPFDATRHTALAAEAESHPGLLGLRATLAAQLADRERQAEDRLRLVERRGVYQARLAEATTAAQSAGYDPAAHEAARLAAHTRREAAHQAELARVQLEGEIKLNDSQRERLLADRETHLRLVAEIERILADRGLLELTRETMERFKISLIGRLRPALERKSSILLNELSEGRYSLLALDEDYCISIGKPGLMRAIEDVSGGEDDLANLCLRLAISELINESVGIGSTFIVLDEVLGSQDADRERQIMDLLPRLYGHFGQILMVAHKPSAQDRFPLTLSAEWDPVTETSSFYYPPRALSLAA